MTPNPLSKPKGGAFKRNKAPRDAASSTSSSNSTSSSVSVQQWGRRGVHFRTRRQRIGSRSLEDLALPLGMSFAAVVAKVLNEKGVSTEKISVDQLFMVCTSAVNESITNIYGDKFDCFLRNFEMSFGSTLKTLNIVNKAPTDGQQNVGCISVLEDNCETADELVNSTPMSAVEEIRESACQSFQRTLKPLDAINDRSSHDQQNAEFSSFIQDTCVTAPALGTSTRISSIEDLSELLHLNSMNNELIPSGHISQQLAVISQTSSEFSPMMSTFERSVYEQARSNDLKEKEIRVAVTKLQLKQSQLALSSYSNMLEKMKITMGISKASFKEEKLKNQMEETRHAQLLKTLIDLLVAGLILMCCCLAYGVSTYSYQRITEATAACTGSSMSTWTTYFLPKQIASLNSGWLMLRCHAMALSRLTFGILMILAIAYLVFQRSAMTSSNMPVTFLILLLGGFCGFAGKLCIDTLGGSGYQWLIYWEALCLLHFFANVFPSIVYSILYGPVSVSNGTQTVCMPYWIRRYTVYAILLILPTMTGLLPFASLHDWKKHFYMTLTTTWNQGNDEL